MRTNRLWTVTAAACAAWIFVLGPALLMGQASPSTQSPDSEHHGIDATSIDPNCKPCQDFYRYANAGWLDKNPVPPAYPSWNRFSELQETNRENLRKILEEAAANRQATPGSNLQKIGDFYASCMDETRVEAEGLKPLLPEIQRIDAIQSLGDLRAEVARLHESGVNALFRFRSTQDAKDSTQVIGGADQAGLGLPDRDYYLDTGKKPVDEKNQKIREQYVAHVTKMLELMGEEGSKAADDAHTVMRIETSLAQVSMDRVDRRDPDKTYHKMDLSQLKTLAPNLEWEGYFGNIGFPGISTVNVGEPKFFEGVSQQLATVPLSDWKTYLRWHLIDAAAPSLSKTFVDEDFDFRGRVLQGTKELLPRWKRCVAATDRQLGEALGEVYVEKYFPPEAKERAQQMVQNLVAALREDLQTLPWMGPETRQQALAKLDAFTRKIGYPDKWRDYSAFHVERETYALNVMHGNHFELDRDLKKIGKPVDRTEWGMSPPTVNAYYNPEKNEIVFPAGILQPPFFDPKADDAVNYGGIGAVIGHEMTHGFDDSGRKFDAQGNLHDWWTPQDEKNFTARAECVRKQFDSYVVEGELHENGKLVLGESIADLGGLTIAYRALEKALEGKPRAPIDGLTPEQRFFLSFTQLWAANDRPEFDRLMVNTNPHPLNRFRGIAAPSNLPAFAQAFNCQEGDAMIRPAADRCQIW